MSSAKKKRAPRAPQMVTLTVRLTQLERDRLAHMSAKSVIPIEQWLVSAVRAAIAVDEAHWEELETREGLRRDIDRTRFGTLSRHLRGLPSGAIDQLVEMVVEARVLGREEGTRSAQRLALVRSSK